MISDFLRHQARRQALKYLAGELKRYQERVEATDSATFLNIFNTGVYVNVKKLGETGLKLARKLLENEQKRRKKL
jgi:hypothetical protein